MSQKFPHWRLSYKMRYVGDLWLKCWKICYFSSSFFSHYVQPQYSFWLFCYFLCCLSVSVPPALRIQGSLFANDTRMYIGICLGGVSFTRKQHITNTSLVINDNDLDYEHVVQLILALTYLSACTHSWHTDRHTQFCTDAPKLQLKQVN